MMMITMINLRRRLGRGRLGRRRGGPCSVIVTVLVTVLVIVTVIVIVLVIVTVIVIEIVIVIVTVIVVVIVIVIVNVNVIVIVIVNVLRSVFKIPRGPRNRTPSNSESD